MAVVGLDVGTTGTKAVVFGDGMEVLASGYEEYRLHASAPGRYELDPGEVWGAVARALGRAVAEANEPVRALGVSVLGEAVVPVDEHGETLVRAILGFDSRGDAIAAEFAERFGPERFFAICGQPPSGISTLFKILWWRAERPGVYARATRFLTFEELILSRLGGHPAIDPSMAARAMCLDVRRRAWSEEILDAAGLPAEKLGLVAESGTVVGNAGAEARRLGLPAACVLVVGGHDQCCAALGADVVEQDRALYSIGTVEAVATVSERFLHGPELLRANLPCYPHVDGRRFVSLGYHFSGGSLLKWFQKELARDVGHQADERGADPYALLMETLPEEPSRLLILPHFAGSGTPSMDAHSRGAILGLTLATTREEMLRACLEAAAFEIRLNLELMQEAGFEPRLLHAVGGGTRSERLMQLKADVLGLPVRTLAVSEAAALGAGALAAAAVGEAASPLAAVKAGTAVVGEYEPHEARRYEERYAIYRSLYEGLRPFSDGLSTLSGSSPSGGRQS